MKKISLLLIICFIINIITVFSLNKDLNRLVIICVSVLIYAALYIILLKIHKKTNQINNIIFFTFLIIITAQGIISFNYKNTVSSGENRVLALLPSVNPFHENFAKKMDTYINDRIGLRGEAIKIYSSIPYMNDYNIQNKVLKGVDGWLYLNDGNNYLYYQGVKKYNKEKLEVVRNSIEKNIEFCEKNNISLITIIPPDKATIYPEYYNKYIKKLSGKENYIILKEYIEKTFKDKKIIVPYNELTKAKENLLYFVKDSHWNSYGAYTAYKLLESSIKEIYPSYKTIDADEIIKCDRSDYTHNDLEKMLGIINITSNTVQDICPKEKGILDLRYENAHQTIWWKKSYGSKEAPKILLIHDSFMVELAPFIEKGASEIGSICTYDNDFNSLSDIILSFKPDLIIWERVERLWFE